MLGRGIDQLFVRRSLPALREQSIRDARGYGTLAEELHGPIKRPVDPPYVWGDALGELDRISPDARLVNLETSITSSEHCWPGKEVHYRLHPANVASITAARIVACALVNNHVLDFGREGLLDTLGALRMAGVCAAGAGGDLGEARAAARVRLRGAGPCSWSASAPGAAVSLWTGRPKKVAQGSTSCRTRRSGPPRPSPSGSVPPSALETET